MPSRNPTPPPPPHPGLRFPPTLIHVTWAVCVCRSIVQFAYGEDGIDVMNVSYLREFGFLSRNAERFAQQLNLQQALQAAGDLTHWEQEARALPRSVVQGLQGPYLLFLHSLNV